MDLQFSAAEFAARLARVRAAMARQGVDVLLVTCDVEGALFPFACRETLGSPM
jgi:hypothetical protein